MKKQYIAPELEKIIFNVEDIITQSLATSGGPGETGGDNGVDFSDWMNDFSFDGEFIYFGDDVY